MKSPWVKMVVQNPMINSGAITVHSLIQVKHGLHSAEILRRFMSELAGRELSLMSLFMIRKSKPPTVIFRSVICCERWEF